MHRDVRVGRFLYTPAAIIPFIYDKVYASDGDTLFAYIYPLGVVCRGVCNVTAWVGYIFLVRKAAQMVGNR